MIEWKHDKMLNLTSIQSKIFNFFKLENNKKIWTWQLLFVVYENCVKSGLFLTLRIDIYVENKENLHRGGL